MAFSVRLTFVFVAARLINNFQAPTFEHLGPDLQSYEVRADRYVRIANYLADNVRLQARNG